MPKPVITPLTESLPKGPASKTAGGRFATGPVMAGVLSAMGAAGAAEAAGAAACASGPAVGAGGAADWATCVSMAGAFCAAQTETNPKQRGKWTRVFKYSDFI